MLSRTAIKEWGSIKNVFLSLFVTCKHHKCGNGQNTMHYNLKKSQFGRDQIRWKIRFQNQGSPIHNYFSNKSTYFLPRFTRSGEEDMIKKNQQKIEKFQRQDGPQAFEVDCTFSKFLLYSWITQNASAPSKSGLQFQFFFLFQISNQI